MPTVPVVPTFGTGELFSTTLNALADAVQFLQRPPIVQLRQAVAQTLTTAVAAAITFTTEITDTDVDGIGGHDNAVNTSRFTARYPGYYAFAGGVAFASNAVGIRQVLWATSGVLFPSNAVWSPATGTATNIVARTVTAYLGIGDYMELYALQSSGGNLNTSVSSNDPSSMTGWWVSSA